MKKRIIIVISIIAVLVLATGSVFAAFVFNSRVTGTANLGDIQIIEEKLISYAPDIDKADYSTTNDYLAGLKGRNYKKVDVTSETFVNHPYLYTLTPTAVSAYTPQTTYYLYDSSENTYTVTAVLIGATSFTNKYTLVATKAESFTANTDYYEMQYTELAESSIECYATEKQGYAEETDDIYLNQLGFKFTFKATVDSYVRIKFNHAWATIKTYNGVSNNPYYDVRKLTNSTSPFNVTDEDWTYDLQTDYSYKKSIVLKSNENQSYLFNIDSTYFAEHSSLTNGHEAIKIQLSYAVDIVQANRAYAIWGADALEKITG